MGLVFPLFGLPFVLTWNIAWIILTFFVLVAFHLASCGEG